VISETDLAAFDLRTDNIDPLSFAGVKEKLSEPVKNAKE